MGIEGMKWNEDEVVYLCGCDEQEYYECGGAGRKNCPYAGICKRSELPDGAVGPGTFGEYHLEG